MSLAKWRTAGGAFGCCGLRERGLGTREVSSILSPSDSVAAFFKIHEHFRFAFRHWIQGRSFLLTFPVGAGSQARPPSTQRSHGYHGRLGMYMKQMDGLTEMGTTVFDSGAENCRDGLGCYDM